MDSKVKSARIRKLRSEKLWSQEQLATISGLGLRTIQRLESRGSASAETLKALAAVFEVPAESLVWRDGSYQCYSHKQWGVATVTAMIIIATLILAIDAQWHILPTPALGVLFGVLTMVGIVFSSMTIEVNESDISWYFGPGIFKKQLALEEVGACQKVKNPLWMGFGIHSFGTGYIYNVSGLLGIEIELKGGAFIRLGTDEPNYLLQAIADAQDNALP